MGHGSHAHGRASGRLGLVALSCALVLALAGATTWVVLGHRDRPSSAAPPATSPMTTARADAVSATTTTVPGPPPGSKPLHLISTIGGPISPKSVDATGTGLVFAQNMMYRHTMTVYASNGVLRRTIPDSVVFARFHIGGHPGVSRGAPVEAAVTPDHTHMWVSNYSMYGAGFGPEGSDTCSADTGYADGYTDSYLYRVSLKTLTIDGVAKVRWVPKYVSVTPNGRWVLATNWCSYDLSIVSAATMHQVALLPIGAYPRGIAISPDSRLPVLPGRGGRPARLRDPRHAARRRLHLHRVQPAPRRDQPERPVPLRHAQPARRRGQDPAIFGSDPRHRPHRQRLPLARDLDERHHPLRRQLPLQHDVDDQGERPQGAPDGADRTASRRHHVRPGERARVGRGLHGRDHGLRRQVPPLATSAPRRPPPRSPRG